ncbi:3,4-dihydroxy-2-butanone-4-phosphate synthase [Altererythrobacter salegens]|uniref:3,4-dihydroxy-2-butanone 4-phosphate synthase n=1 Tax=Croceibacterium salegens TaxID=1737568 RepID=A0A6I4T062_9SPHN|nr:3,4-dihydroxy-2-butanone-4-phosphate synthase [Croceibacterium salegens]MXO60667.1 3,4-dihydroxy-2-butanone-4-phosphate synthase [Croceibacterium salegens]
MTAPTKAKFELSTPEEIINEARNGRMFILVDDEDRENEGDLVIPGQMATPDAINFMATYGRGLICLALTTERVEQLGLRPMSPMNGTRHETAFTVSIEARAGVTTGISAADRARTIAVAVNSAMGPDDIVTPGHVFPLAARAGGVLTRAGHTEAAVDVARLAGLDHSGVICEILKDDGTMARMPDLIQFSERHGLRIGTIRDLIAYRRKFDSNIEKISEFAFESHFGGSWNAIGFSNKATKAQTLALVKGKLDATSPTLVRMHQMSLISDCLGGKGDREGLLLRSMEIIAEAGSGVIVVLNRATPDYISTVMQARQEGLDPVEMHALRDYGMGAQVLAELGVHEMISLSNSPTSPIALAGYGLSIVGQRPIPPLHFPADLEAAE